MENLNLCYSDSQCKKGETCRVNMCSASPALKPCTDTCGDDMACIDKKCLLSKPKFDECSAGKLKQLKVVTHRGLPFVSFQPATDGTCPCNSVCPAGQYCDGELNCVSYLEKDAKCFDVDLNTLTNMKYPRSCGEGLICAVNKGCKVGCMLALQDCESGGECVPLEIPNFNSGKLEVTYTKHEKIGYCVGNSVTRVLSQWWMIVIICVVGVGCITGLTVFLCKRRNKKIEQQQAALKEKKTKPMIFGPVI